MSSLTNLSSPPSSFPLMDFKQEDENFHFFMSSSQKRQQPSSSSSNSPSSSSLILFNLTQDQRPTSSDDDLQLPQPLHDKVGKCVIGHGGSSDHHQEATSSSSVEQHGMIKISSRSSCNSSTIRTCSDCNTSKTPLWRSGPQGPKSLCNACGIRQRKARRAMAAAATNQVIAVTPNKSTIIRAKAKEKKLHKSLTKQRKKPFKVHGAAEVGDRQKANGSSFEEFALRFRRNFSLQRAFPKDEEEAAVLLMALSCGLICS